MVLYSDWQKVGLIEGICCPSLSNPSLIIAWLRLDLYSCLFFCIKRRIYRNKHNNQTYHTKPDKPNLPNQIFETKPTTKTNQIKPNIWNWHVVWLKSSYFCEILNPWVRCAPGNVLRCISCVERHYIQSDGRNLLSKFASWFEYGTVQEK